MELENLLEQLSEQEGKEITVDDLNRITVIDIQGGHLVLVAEDAEEIAPGVLSRGVSAHLCTSDLLDRYSLPVSYLELSGRDPEEFAESQAREGAIRDVLGDWYDQLQRAAVAGPQRFYEVLEECRETMGLSEAQLHEIIQRF